MSGIERCLEAVAVLGFQIHLVNEMVEFRQDNLRSERQRRDDCPGCDCAVVWHAASAVVEESPLQAANLLRGTGPSLALMPPHLSL